MKVRDTIYTLEWRLIDRVLCEPWPSRRCSAKPCPSWLLLASCGRDKAQVYEEQCCGFSDRIWWLVRSLADSALRSLMTIAADRRRPVESKACMSDYHTHPAHIIDYSTMKRSEPQTSGDGSCRREIVSFESRGQGTHLCHRRLNGYLRQGIL